MSKVEQLITEHIDIWTSAILAKSTAGRGSNKRYELYGIKKLRELILELAVRGKLVPQDFNDEPASVLLEQIAAEKATLIKEGKIKKSKLSLEVSEEEIPFELPSGWEWVKVATLFNVVYGKGLSTSELTDNGYEVFGANGIIGTYDSYNYKEPQLLVSCRGAYSGKANISPAECFITSNTLILENSWEYLSQQFFYYSLLAADKSEIVTGSAQPQVTATNLNPFLIVLPPIAEQKRIVAKVDELMLLCDQLERQTEASIDAHVTLVEVLLATLTDSADANELAQNWARVSEHFATLFTTDQSIEALKQTLLQLAVMGKLVPQDPDDEPAAVLLEKIAAEKEQLIKDKKIKKEKPLLPVSDDEKPFELPQGWEWAKFEDVVDIQGGITKGRKLSGRELTAVPYLRVANVQRGHLLLDHMQSVEIPVEEVDKYKVLARDLLITEGGDWDKVGRTAIWNNELPYVAHQNHVFKARVFLTVQNELWLEAYLNAPFARSYFAGSSKQTTNLASINKTQLRGCLIALPPITEQHRIITKLAEIMQVCDQLKDKLHQSQKNQVQLTDALIDQALG